MAITYTWKITGIKAQDSGNREGVVVQTYWTKTGKNEDGVEGVFHGATPFSAGDIVDEKFVPFTSLSEDIVLSWIKDTVTGPYEERVNEVISDQINEKLAPPILYDDDLPWNRVQE
jgi:hypothetical protein